MRVGPEKKRPDVSCKEIVGPNECPMLNIHASAEAHKESPTGDTKLAAALTLAKRDLAVFPLMPNDKRPAIANWPNLASTDPAQIEAWWTAQPDANIGVSTERLLVVDIDPRNGSAPTMAALRMTEEFPDTWASATAGGGVHLIFALPDRVSVKSVAGKLGAGVDIKSHGGYVVAVGSTIGGKTYRWVPGYSPDDRDIAVAPDWLVSRCKAPNRKTRTAGERIIEEDETALELAEGYLQAYAPEAIEGGRDNTAFKLAAKLFDFGISAETNIALLLEWNEGWCHPPLESHDIERIVWSAGRNRDNAIGSAHPNAPGFEPYEMPESVAPAVTPAPKRRGLYSVPFEEAVGNALTQTSEALIDGLIDRQAMSVWYGESNSGKTFAVLDASYHVAAGRQWMGMDTKQGAVAYVAAEGGKGIGKRLLALHVRYAADAGKVPLFTIPCPVDLLRPDADLKPLIAEVDGIKNKTGIAVELIVVDTLSRALAGGNENDSQDMGRFVSNLDALRVATGAHVAVVHHTGKDKARGARGHSLLRAATDTEIEIDNKTLTVTKQRDMDGEVSISFVLKPVRLGLTKTGKEITSCTVEMRAAGAPVEQLPLQPELLNFKGEIARALLVLCNNDREAVRGRPFSTRFAVECAHKVPAIDAHEHSKDSKALRNRADRWLLELLEKGHVKKVQRGQWILVDAQNAQIAHSPESILCSDAHHTNKVSIDKDRRLAAKSEERGREVAP